MKSLVLLYKYLEKSEKHCFVEPVFPHWMIIGRNPYFNLHSWIPTRHSDSPAPSSGEGGIRTLDTSNTRMPVFETGAFNHSATSPSFYRSTPLIDSEELHSIQ